MLEKWNLISGKCRQRRKRKYKIQFAPESTEALFVCTLHGATLSRETVATAAALSSCLIYNLRRKSAVSDCWLQFCSSPTTKCQHSCSFKIHKVLRTLLEMSVVLASAAVTKMGSAIDCKEGARRDKQLKQ